MESIRESRLIDELLYWIGVFRVFRVSGESMLPTLTDGDLVFLYDKGKIRMGDIVIAKHPYKLNVKILKRVAGINQEGRFFLRSDNSGEGSDSRTFGTLSRNQLLGKVVSKINC